MLKYMPKEGLQTFEKTLTFSRDQTSIFGNLERGFHKSGTEIQRTDAN